MISREWADILFEIYAVCHRLPEWPSVVAMHKQEDRDYFLMLDEILEIGEFSNIRFSSPSREGVD